MTTEAEEQQPDRFLVVDDDQVLAGMLFRALSRQGFPVTAVYTADDAVTACRNQSFDKAVVDMKLAEASGLQLIPKLLAIQPELQIVILTGYSSIATAVEAIKLGAANYLCKPADVEEILAAFQGSAPTNQHNPEEFTPPSVDRLEWEHIQKVLQENDGNISATARALGMHRRTLQRKLNKRPVSR